MLQSFLPVFFMTFFICLFIVLMQFLWRYIDDLVGKGLDISVIAELFFYAALTMVPLALPLALLLASLMTFGNLGEFFELTAMKAAGISLLRVMKPLIWLVVFISIGAFFFQNNILPIAQTKMWTLLFSMRQKTPEVEIPEGVFYDQLPGIDLFVDKKNRESGMLYEMIIYDVRTGMDNARIIRADSGRLSFTEDKTHLFLQLHHGEQFENLRENSAGGRSYNRPYRRESFDSKELLVPFDANFNRMDESTMRNQYVGKNISQLAATVDSVQHRVDSIGGIYSGELLENRYFGIRRYDYAPDASGQIQRKAVVQPDRLPILPPDSIFAAGNPILAKSIINHALMSAQRFRQDYEFKSYSMEDDRKTIRRHGIEMHKKFTLSIACLIFFFIGAPLGAIIRKGGLGMPLVISVILFIIYYIIDNAGYKMARDGRMEVWEGMWLSSAVLLPLGLFFTYKAVNDSGLFNLDAYRNFINRLTGRSRRELEPKEFVAEELDIPRAIELTAALRDAVAGYVAGLGRAPVPVRVLRRILNRTDRALTARLNELVDIVSDTRDASVVAALNRLPFYVTPKNAGTVADDLDRLAAALSRPAVTVAAGNPQNFS